MLKKTPFHSIHQEAGAKLVDFAGFEMPVQYKGIKAEHTAVRQAAGVFDVSHMGEFFIQGPEALRLIQKIGVNDAAKLIPGKAQYSCMCNHDGGIIDDLIIYMLDEQKYMLVVNASNIDKDFEWISQQNTMGAVLENRSADFGLLAVQGPKAPEILQKLTDVDLSSIGFYSFKKGKLAGIEMLISATGYTGEKGFELYFEHKNADLKGLWDSIMEAGSTAGIEPAGLGARDTLRLEMGYVLYGNDISEQRHPLQARLGWITKLDKGDFIGRERLTQIKEKGWERQLVGFVMDDQRSIPRQGYEILNENGESIGEVTSGTMSITLGKGIGMGYVDKAYAADSTTLNIAIRNKPAGAVVTKPPFVNK